MRHIHTHRFSSSEIPIFISSSLCIHTPMVRIHLKNDPYPKYGVIAPKHIGSAVVRNKCKRWLRNILPSIIECIGNPYSIILIAKPKLKNSTFKTCHNMVLLELKNRKML